MRNSNRIPKFTVPSRGRAIEVRTAVELAKVASGIAATSGRKALYRHLRSIQSSNRPMKPPNKMQDANVREAEAPAAGLILSLKKYRRKMYTTLTIT